MANFTPDEFNLPRVPDFRVIDNTGQWDDSGWQIVDIIHHWHQGLHCQYFDPTTGQWSVLWPARAVWMETADISTVVPNIRLISSNGTVLPVSDKDRYYTPPDPKAYLDSKGVPETKKPNLLARLFTKG